MSLTFPDKQRGELTIQTESGPLCVCDFFGDVVWERIATTLFSGDGSNIIDTGVILTGVGSFSTWFYYQDIFQTPTTRVFGADDGSQSTLFGLRRHDENPPETQGNISGGFGDQSANVIAGTQNAVTNYEWTHAVFTWNESENVTLYRNGEIDYQGAAVGNATKNVTAWVGHVNGDATQNFYQGFLRYAQIWNRPLLASEVKTLYENT